MTFDSSLVRAKRPYRQLRGSRHNTLAEHRLSRQGQILENSAAVVYRSLLIHRSGAVLKEWRGYCRVFWYCSTASFLGNPDNSEGFKFCSWRMCVTRPASNLRLTFPQ